MKQKKLKIVFVVQRYGEKITGGAELHARWLAEHLSKYWDITVITTKAIDYFTWKDDYKKDKEFLNGVKVLRFPVDKERNIEQFNKFSEKVFSPNHTLEEEIKWMKLQGPYSTPLFNYLKSHKDYYDAFIFVTYLYATTYFGLPLVKDKAFLIPTAHDEAPLYLKIFKKIFNQPRGIIASTPEELTLIRNVFKNNHVPARIIGVGINLPNQKSINTKKSLKKFKLKNPYILYLGRIEPAKGVHELFEYFTRLKSEEFLNLDLVLAGRAVMDIPKRKDIKFLGFVSEEEKFALIKGCEFLVNPSKYESLSMIIMEASLQQKTVLVNGNCEVLKGQCLRAQGGLWYENYEEFKEMVKWLLKHKKERKIMGINGEKYIKSNYSWEIIEKKFINFISEILGRR